jgi:hypothetical protein
MFQLLKFKKHPLDTGPARVAEYTFDNGWRISVLFGDMFYSNGVDTYEVAVIDEDGEFSHPEGLDCWFSGSDGQVMGHLSAEEISEIMFELSCSLPMGEI